MIGADRTRVSQTSGKIRIVLTIPDSLKNTDSGTTRSFAVVRVHDGEAELLADMDNEEATITIETDQFSTYALVYQDTANTGGQEPDDGGSGACCDLPDSGVLPQHRQVYGRKLETDGVEVIYLWGMRINASICTFHTAINRGRFEKTCGKASYAAASQLQVDYGF